MEVTFITFKVAPPELIGDVLEESSSSPSKSEIYIDIFAVLSIACLLLVSAWWAYKVKYNRGQGSMKYTLIINGDEDKMNVKL